MSIREKVIDIILEVAMAHHDDCSAIDVANAAEAADQALSDLEKLVIEALPKEKELLIRIGKPKNSRHNKEIMGYNQALNECKSALKKAINSRKR